MNHDNRITNQTTRITNTKNDQKSIKTEARHSTNRAGIRMPRLAAGQVEHADSRLSATTTSTIRATVIGGCDAA